MKKILFFIILCSFSFAITSCQSEENVVPKELQREKLNLSAQSCYLKTTAEEGTFLVSGTSVDNLCFSFKSTEDRLGKLERMLKGLIDIVNPYLSKDEVFSDCIISMKENIINVREIKVYDLNKMNPMLGAFITVFMGPGGEYGEGYNYVKVTCVRFKEKKEVEDTPRKYGKGLSSLRAMVRYIDECLSSGGYARVEVWDTGEDSVAPEPDEPV